ncbi:AAA family ATPase [bacterium]|nr:AAA family ATPase [bacterium]
MTDKAMYSEEYQIKVLSYMLSNSQFRDIAFEVISREHFANRALQWYFDTIGAAKIPLTSFTLKEELVKAAQTKQVRETEVDKLVSYYAQIRQPPLPVEEQHIQETFEKFIRTQAMKQAILESLDLIKSEDWDTVVSNIEAARNTGMDILSVGVNYFKEFQDRMSRRAQREEERKLSTGIPELDALMFGGLKTKQMGIIVGGSGRGKSIFLEWLARTGVILGQQVVYYTLELSAEDIADRFDSLFCHIRPQELRSQNDRIFKELHPLADRLGNNLIIKEYPEGEASINTVKGHYKQLAGIGVRPGLVVIDYVDLMKPHRNYNDHNQEQKAVVQSIRGMSKEFETRVWTALQFNRGGMVQDTPDESGIAGSISRFYTADTVIFMAQTPDEREDEIMRLILKKNRNGPADRSVKITTDYAHMTFYRGPATDTALQSNAAPDTSWAGDSDDEPELDPGEVEQIPADSNGMAILD